MDEGRPAGPGQDISQSLASLNNVELPESEERINPSVMTMLAQLAQLGHLNRLRQCEEAKVPLRSRAYTATITERSRVSFPNPLINFALLNDGPNTVQVAVNDVDQIQHEIKAGEFWEFNAGYAVIEDLWFQVVEGESATVRVRGTEGIKCLPTWRERLRG